MNKKTFITYYELAKNNEKYLDKLVKYWTQLVDDTVFSSEIAYLYSILIKNNKLQRSIFDLSEDRLRYANIRKVALSLSKQPFLGVIFFVLNNRVYAYEHKCQNSKRLIKPIRECSQFSKMKDFMLEAEKGLINKTNGKYEFCPVYVKWLHFPIEDIELIHLGENK